MFLKNSFWQEEQMENRLRTNGDGERDGRRKGMMRNAKKVTKPPKRRIATEEGPLREPVIAEKFDSSEGSEEKR